MDFTSCGRCIRRSHCMTLFAFLWGGGPELPAMACVIALPEIAVSTPKAFAEWDKLAEQSSARTGEGARPHASSDKLTVSGGSDRMTEFSREISAWLSAASERGRRRSGVS